MLYKHASSVDIVACQHRIRGLRGIVNFTHVVLSLLPSGWQQSKRASRFLTFSGAKWTGCQIRQSKSKPLGSLVKTFVIISEAKWTAYIQQNSLLLLLTSSLVHLHQSYLHLKRYLPRKNLAIRPLFPIRTCSSITLQHGIYPGPVISHQCRPAFFQALALPRLKKKKILPLIRTF